MKDDEILILIQYRIKQDLHDIFNLRRCPIIRSLIL
jgi:hypothetical protein